MEEYVRLCVNGISNQDNSTIPEAEKMKDIALSLEINENDILVDDLIEINYKCPDII